MKRKLRFALTCLLVAGAPVGFLLGTRLNEFNRALASLGGLIEVEAWEPRYLSENEVAADGTPDVAVATPLPEKSPHDAQIVGAPAEVALGQTSVDPRTPSHRIAASTGTPELDVADNVILKRQFTGSSQAALAYLRRTQRTQPVGAMVGVGLGGKQLRPAPETEKAISHGTSFLASRQQASGAWRFGSSDAETSLESETAATGLALLALLGSGNSHRDGRFDTVVEKGLDYLIANQRDDGDLYTGHDSASSSVMWLYSHGIATIALCEAFGMTGDDRLREPAERAIAFIVKAQNGDGGWRYAPGIGADTSVSGWLMMALHSGRCAGLKVDDEVFRDIEAWLDKAQVSAEQRHLYRYNPDAPNIAAQRHGREPNPTMTAVGLLMRLYQGWGRDNPHLIAGAEYLLDHLPENGDRANPKRDAYYWYYGTQVMLHMGGDYWNRWNEAIHKLVVDSQVAGGGLMGSWDPAAPVSDRWGGHAGRLYITTLNLLTLEVHYRHLPIHEDLRPE